MKRLYLALLTVVSLLALPGVGFAAPGDLDTSFGSGGRASFDIDGFDQGMAAALDGSGRVVIAGQVNSASERDVAVARLTVGGGLDPSFAGGAGFVLRDPSPAGQDFVDSVVVAPDGRILVGGAFHGAAGLLRYRTDGLPDTGFYGDGMVKRDFGHPQRSGGAVLLPDGRSLWFGRGDYSGSIRDLDLARFNADGGLDTAFGAGGLVRLSLIAGTGYEHYRAALLLPDGKLLVGGDSGGAWLMARLHPDGTFDLGFGSGGYTVTDFTPGNDFLYDIARQPDGRIVAVGGQSGTDNIAVARFLPDGAPDPSFGTGGRVTVDLGGEETAYALALQPNGKIAVAGETDATGTGDDMFVIRLMPDGTLDQGFGVDGIRIIDFDGGDDAARDLLLQADGQLVAVGEATVSGSSDFAAVRLAGDPTPGPGGDPGGGASAEADSVVGLRILGKRLIVNRRGVLKLRLRCPKSETNPPCSGRIVLQTRRMLRAGKGKARRIPLARKTFAIGAGKTRAVRIKLTRQRLRLLQRRPAARQLRVVAQVRDRAGNRATVRTSMRLRIRR